MKLDTPVQYLTGVGPVMAKKLKGLGIEDVRDLLFYFPRRWDDFSRPQKIKNLFIGQDAIIYAKIIQIKQNRTHRKWMSIIEAVLVDDSGSEIKAIWFNQPFLIKILKPNEKWLFSGKVGFDNNQKIKVLNVSQYEKELSTGALILSVYPETKGLTSKYLRKIIKLAIDKTEQLIIDYLPKEISKKEILVGLAFAIKNIHFPKKSENIEIAKKRLAFDELFLIALRMLVNKKELQNNRAPILKYDPKILQQFVQKLPFKLTNAQRRSAWEIIKGISSPSPMNRLLEGDVGSGKTVVAAMAVLVASQNRYDKMDNWQSVWLAPTEILANQHFNNISKILKPFKIKVGLLTSASKYSNLEDDDLIIGTHAILQKNIKIPRLALIIIDEQHRFGVKQRAHLRNTESKENIPHLLSMTATPIPRTLALSFYGDLDISVIDELPKGRQKINTKVVKPNDRKIAYEFIEKEVKSGRQVFVICPLIEPKDSNKINLFEADRKSAVQEYEKLSKEIFPKFKIGLLHGKMKSCDKVKIMADFKNKKIDILVSTAVVEVGIDIPNASVMMIEGADRFGLAQLHQFRGRVGRGIHKSYCFLFAGVWSEKTQQRLEAMVDCQNGFELAEIDLKIRGPGELIGIRQSGIPDLKMASLSDTMLVRSARQAAEVIIKKDIKNYPDLEKKLQEYEKKHHLE